MNEYIKGKGVLVGIFDKQEVIEGKDKIAVEKVKQETGHQYTNTEYIKKKKEIVGLKVYVCSVEDMRL